MQNNFTKEETSAFLEQVCADNRLRVETDFGGGFVKLKISEAEKRQAAQDIRFNEDICIELLRNSRDAGAKNIYIATQKDGNKRLFVVLDDGEGIPNNMHAHIFEPRVTSKLDTANLDRWGLHGRGMALYSISENSLLSKVVLSNTKCGCSLKVISNPETVSEKADQSTFPIAKISNGLFTLKGPKNILRTAVEFAIDNRNTVSVYVGSQTEIAATIYSNALSRTSCVQMAFNKELFTDKVCEWLAVADTPEQFSEISSNIGLEISCRSARRILNGQIEPLKSLFDQINSQVSSIVSNTSNKQNRLSDLNLNSTKKLKVSKEDSNLFLEHILDAFNQLADSYYLDKDIIPEIKYSEENIKIIIPVKSQ